MTKKARSKPAEGPNGFPPELLAAWRELYSTQLPRDPHRLAPEAPRFVDYAWGRFDTATVLRVLTSEQQSYRALKPILFSGFCTWVVCPKRNSIRKHGMLLTGIEYLKDAEQTGRNLSSNFEIPGGDLFGDILGRLTVLGQDFYSDFYYPVGGLGQVLRCTSRAVFSRSIAHHTRFLNTVITMMKIFDFHAKKLSEPTVYYPASASKGYKLVKIINGNMHRETGVSIEISEQRWKESSSTCALIYAAHTVKDSNNVSLLELICRGEVNFETHGPFLENWLRRARYVSDEVLGRTTQKEIGRVNASALPEVPPDPTPEPHFSESEKATIEAEFDRAAILKNRQRTERQASKVCY